MKAIVLIASIAVASGFAPPASSQGGGAVVATKPGAAMVGQTVKINATITAIDQDPWRHAERPARQQVVIAGSGGEELRADEGRRQRRRSVPRSVDAGAQEGRRQAGRANRGSRGGERAWPGLPVEVGK